MHFRDLLPETLQLLACWFWGGAGSLLLLRRMSKDLRNNGSSHKIQQFHDNAAKARRNYQLKPVRGEENYFQSSAIIGVLVLERSWFPSALT